MAPREGALFLRYDCRIGASQWRNHSLKPASLMPAHFRAAGPRGGRRRRWDGAKNRPASSGRRLDAAGPRSILLPPTHGGGMKGIDGNPFEVQVSSCSICDCSHLTAAPITGSSFSLSPRWRGGDEMTRLHIILPLSFIGVNM